MVYNLFIFSEYQIFQSAWIKLAMNAFEDMAIVKIT